MKNPKSCSSGVVALEQIVLMENSTRLLEMLSSVKDISGCLSLAIAWRAWRSIVGTATSISSSVGQSYFWMLA